MAQAVGAADLFVSWRQRMSGKVCEACAPGFLCCHDVRCNRLVAFTAGALHISHCHPAFHSQAARNLCLSIDPCRNGADFYFEVIGSKYEEAATNAKVPATRSEGEAFCWLKSRGEQKDTQRLWRSRRAF